MPKRKRQDIEEIYDEVDWLTTLQKIVTEVKKWREGDNKSKILTLWHHLFEYSNSTEPIYKTLVKSDMQKITDTVLEIGGIVNDQQIYKLCRKALSEKRDGFFACTLIKYLPKHCVNIIPSLCEDDMSQFGSSHNTLLDMAIKNGNIIAVSALVVAGAQIDMKNGLQESVYDILAHKLASTTKPGFFHNIMNYLRRCESEKLTQEQKILEHAIILKTKYQRIDKKYKKQHNKLFEVDIINKTTNSEKTNVDISDHTSLSEINNNHIFDEDFSETLSDIHSIASSSEWNFDDVS